MKMQIAFRETSTERHGHVVAMAGGVIEIGDDEMLEVDERALAFKFSFSPFSDHPLAVAPVGAPRPIVDQFNEVENTLQVGTIEDFLTLRIQRATPNDQHNADFVLRETELPASEVGATVFAFSGLLHLKPGQPFDFRNQLWFESFGDEPGHEMLFAGRTGIERRPDEADVDMVGLMAGQAMTNLLRLPLWGFGAVSYGLPGTMRLENYARIERYQHLSFLDDRTDAEEDELDDLRRFMQFAGLNTLEKDETYRRYLKRLREDFPEYTGYRPMTADQITSKEDNVATLIRAVLEDDETPSLRA